MQVTERIDAGRAWTLTALAGVAALILGSLVFYDTVYRGFVWHYFWGPVYADAHNAVAAVHRGGSVELLYSPAARQSAVAAGQVVAEPGYTLVSEVGYMVVLLFGLIGVLQLLRRLDVGRDRDLFFALIPFMLFGGALRVVEDANDAVPEGVSQAIAYPWNTLIISPIIYFTVFFVTLGSLLVTVWLRREGYVETYARPMAAVGSAAFYRNKVSLATWSRWPSRPTTSSFTRRSSSASSRSRRCWPPPSTSASSDSNPRSTPAPA
jgi:uncharacterized membrane protein